MAKKDAVESLAQTTPEVPQTPEVEQTTQVEVPETEQAAATTPEAAPAPVFPLTFAFSVKGKAGGREFNIPMTVNITDMEMLGRALKALLNRKFAEYLSGLKSRGELEGTSVSDVLTSFEEFMGRWLAGEKKARSSSPASVEDAVEAALALRLQGTGLDKAAAKKAAAQHRSENSDLWKKAVAALSDLI